VKVQSQSAHIDWAAAKSVTLATAGGASITIAGGNITVQCPGTITVRASNKSFTGPMRELFALPKLPDGKLYRGSFIARDETTGDIMPDVAYTIVRADGSEVHGITDAHGRTTTVYTPTAEDLKFKVLERKPEPKFTLYRCGDPAQQLRVLDYKDTESEA
jgi:type VI secretion system secreted protein VgrG